MNRIFMSGIVAETPVLITAQDGTARIMFRICVSHRNRNGVTKRELYPVNAWHNVAKWAHEHLSMGQRVSLEGYLTLHHDGAQEDAQRIEVTADEFFAGANATRTSA